MNILIFIFCVLYFILAFRRLDWAVMLLIAALPSYLIRFSVFGIPLTLLEVMILISFAVWVLKNYREVINNIKLKIRHSTFDIRHSQRYPFDVEIVLLLVISFVAVGIAGFSDSALGIWKAYFFEPALLFIIILNVFKGKDGSNKLLWSFLISALAVSVLAIYQKFTGAFIFNEFWATEETRRVTSFFGYPNAVGLYLGPMVMILFGWMIRELRITNYELRIKVIKLIFILFTIILSVLAIYFAKSEGALIGVITGLVIFGLLAGKKIRWATLGLVVVAVAGIITFAPAREYAVNKVLLRDLSGQFRRAQWAETWDMLKDGRLITGSGLANYKDEILPYHQEGIFVRDYNDPDWHRKTVWNEEYRNKVWQPLEIYLYPHNIFLNFWVELGIGGLLLFVWIIGKYFVIGVKLIRKSKIENRKLVDSKNNFIVIGLLGTMIVIVIHGFVDVPYFKNDLAVMFWIFVAMVSLINLELKHENKK
jgi:putative inorganic carbon (HCO3(-)) transporter